jgi:hypothetical protein
MRLKNTKECTVTFSSTLIFLYCWVIWVSTIHTLTHRCICKASMVMWFGELTFCLRFVAEYRFIPSNNLRQPVCILHWSFKEFSRHPFPNLCLVLCLNEWHKFCASTHLHSTDKFSFRIFWNDLYEMPIWFAICSLISHLSNRNCGILATFSSLNDAASHLLHFLCYSE